MITGSDLEEIQRIAGLDDDAFASKLGLSVDELQTIKRDDAEVSEETEDVAYAVADDVVRKFI
jgi:hypothetical protein